MSWKWKDKISKETAILYCKAFADTQDGEQQKAAMEVAIECIKKCIELEDFSKEAYPEDCQKIWKYLGKEKIKPEELAWLYREYCNEVWCAGWIQPHEQDLQEFEKWLESRNG